MAELIGNIPWIGTLGTLNAYKRQDSDKIILRGKRRTLSEAERNSPKYELTRFANKEFGGRSRVSSSIMTSMIELKSLADYNIAGPINSILTPIQLADPVNPKGKRSIALSKHAHLLQGFNFNRKHTFDSVVRSRIHFSLDKETLTAKVTIPELLRDINLFLPNNYPLFGFTLVIGLVPDFTFQMGEYRAVNDEGHGDASWKTQNTEWFHSGNGCKEINLEINLMKPNLPSSFTLLLGIGIRYGTVGEGAVLERVKFAGCAKIIVLWASIRTLFLFRILVIFITRSFSFAGRKGQMTRFFLFICNWRSLIIIGVLLSSLIESSATGILIFFVGNPAMLLIPIAFLIFIHDSGI